MISFKEEEYQVLQFWIIQVININKYLLIGHAILIGMKWKDRKDYIFILMIFDYWHLLY